MHASNTTIAAGPVLFARGADVHRCRLAVLLVLHGSPDAGVEERHSNGTATGSDSDRSNAPELRPMGGETVVPVVLARLADHVFLRYDFELPATETAFYELDGARHPVVTSLGGALRIAYVSCNGLEHGDRERPVEERNRMWRRLAAEHGRAPFALLLHGGDQLYADEASASHPTLEAWADSPLDERGWYAFDVETERAATDFFVERYVTLYAQPDVAPLIARTPSAMMWDDHDIFDGWGSHPAALLDSPVGRGLFEVARQAFLLFQRALSPEECAPPGGSLSYALHFPGFALVAPDLRSERRLERILGPEGWARMKQHLEEAIGVEQLFLLSSVPLLGPRLSLIERLIGVIPKLRRYEDDLRDQWQSRAHRDEWRRILERVDQVARAGSDVTALSGEIHLASRGTMPLGEGRTLHQLIASGIAHPPPPDGWARVLGWLAALGEDPVPGRRVTLAGLPGRRGIYTNERNYLVLEREAGLWQALWECEDGGRTSPLALSSSGREKHRRPPEQPP